MSLIDNNYRGSHNSLMTRGRVVFPVMGNHIIELCLL